MLSAAFAVFSLIALRLTHTAGSFLWDIATTALSIHTLTAFLRGLPSPTATFVADLRSSGGHCRRGLGDSAATDSESTAGPRTSSPTFPTSGKEPVGRLLLLVRCTRVLQADDAGVAGSDDATARVVQGVSQRTTAHGRAACMCASAAKAAILCHRIEPGHGAALRQRRLIENNHDGR